MEEAAAVVTREGLSKILYDASVAFNFEFESGFLPLPYMHFAIDNWLLSVVFVVVYLIFLVYGPKHMENLKAFDLRKELAAWNGLLCLFSTLGMCRTVRFLS